jgi:uncharacterized membrane protein
VRAGKLTPRWPLSLIGSKLISRSLLPLAAAELVGDKLPVTPSRTEPAGLSARIFSGVCIGACVAPRDSEVGGALVGGIGAVIGTFAFHALRVMLPRALDKPDLVVALLEDAIAVGGSVALVGGCGDSRASEPVEAWT